ncbi:HTH-type transcriptional activator RhaS [bioreactor metagenome]|jgi:AraC-like DNA-binding protein|uniref:HTH-type transcriptional activator RhaS n=1 Tax=bioreactor metagenome TaxID=1076179 RepID=A0A644SZB2_9ZZZZ
MNIKENEAILEVEELAIAKRGLLSRIDRWTPACGTHRTAIGALSFVRWERPLEARSYIQEPSICLIAQGAKRIFLGKENYSYDANHFLITAMDVPFSAQILEASKEQPYLSLMLKLDPKAISQLLVDCDFPSAKQSQSSKSVIVSELRLPLLATLTRLIDLLDEPDSIPILAPLIQREILYRLLVSEQGPYLRQIGTAGSHGYQISRAIEWMKHNFRKQLRIEDLASYCQMSTSSLHHHFKTMTSMSPLQYQKLLRLQEARRLMLAESFDAASAAFQVGYESPSQFSREYRRLFSASPARDIKALLSAGNTAPGPGPRRKASSSSPPGDPVNRHV